MTNTDKKKNYLTYGAIISLMLDYCDSDNIAGISYDPQNFNGEISKNKNEDYVAFLTSRSFLFSHGVFNEYCYFYQFKNRKDIRNYYLNTMFVVLPAFEFESMDALNKMIKTIKQVGILQLLKNGLKNETGGSHASGRFQAGRCERLDEGQEQRRTLRHRISLLTLTWNNTSASRTEDMLSGRLRACLMRDDRTRVLPVLPA